MNAIAHATLTAQKNAANDALAYAVSAFTDGRGDLDTLIRAQGTIEGLNIIERALDSTDPRGDLIQTVTRMLLQDPAADAVYLRKRAFALQTVARWMAA